MIMYCYSLKQNENGLPYLEKGKCLRGEKIEEVQDLAKFLTWNLDLLSRAEEYVFAIALLQDQVRGVFELSHGLSDCTIARPKELFIRLLLVGADGFILVHNHPSGNIKPSKEDKDVQKRFQQASEIVGFKFLDFIIVGDKILSFREENLFKIGG